MPTSLMSKLVNSNLTSTYQNFIKLAFINCQELWLPLIFKSRFVYFVLHFNTEITTSIFINRCKRPETYFKLKYCQYSKNCQLYQSCKIEIRKFLSFDFRIHAWEWRKSLNPWKYKSVVWSYRRLKIQILNLNFDQNRIWLLSWTWAKKSKLIYIMHLIPELDLTAILYQCSG